MNQKMIFVYITAPSQKKAKDIAFHLLEKRLIACANIFPVKSLYWWKKEIKEDNEAVLICKTLEGNFGKVKNHVERIHPYKAPCIASISANSNIKFYNWLEKQLVH